MVIERIWRDYPRLTFRETGWYRFTFRSKLQHKGSTHLLISPSHFQLNLSFLTLLPQSKWQTKIVQRAIASLLALLASLTTPAFLISLSRFRDALSTATELLFAPNPNHWQPIFRQVSWGQQLAWSISKMMMNMSLSAFWSICMRGIIL